MSKNKPSIASEVAQALGRRGGIANVRKHGKSHMRKIGKYGAQVRWAKTHKPFK